MTELTGAQRGIVDDLYRALTHDPGYLLMKNGSVPRVHADVWVARLVGREDELVHERVMTERPLDIILTPEPTRILMDVPDETAMLGFRRAEWFVQSGVATASVSAETVMPWPFDRATFECRIVALTYKLPPLVPPAGDDRTTPANDGGE